LFDEALLQEINALVAAQAGRSLKKNVTVQSFRNWQAV